MQHIQHEADTLAQRDESDHHGQDCRQQADNLIEHAADHISGHDAAQLSGNSGHGFSLRSTPLSYFIYGCGSLIRTGVLRFRASCAAITPSRDINFILPVGPWATDARP